MLKIWNKDCIEGSKEELTDKSVDLIICDPPFGINESTFDKHYNREEATVIEGYVEAPKDYATFTFQWMEQASRVLKDNGTFYVISGWSNLVHILNAANKLKLIELNHCIWKFNFGVATSKKFVTSHYHVMRFSKIKNPKFNTYCRFGMNEKNEHGGSLLYKDLEDVFVINKEYSPGEIKNKNKLPKELIEKLVLYSSDPGDVVCDFFMGNFTTGYVANSLGRSVVGFELNKNSYDHHYPIITSTEPGERLKTLKRVDPSVPMNKGKRISDEEKTSIKNDFLALGDNMTKSEKIRVLCNKYSRGSFSISNILKK